MGAPRPRSLHQPWTGLPVLLNLAPINLKRLGQGTHGIATEDFTWQLKAETRRPESSDRPKSPGQGQLDGQRPDFEELPAIMRLLAGFGGQLLKVGPDFCRKDPFTFGPC